MSQRVLLLLSVVILVASGLAGCFGDDAAEAKTNGIPGNELPPFETTLYVHKQMFHPYPGGMLSGWVFSEDPEPPTDMVFEPPVLRVKEGQTVRITLQSMLSDTSLFHTIHWHGLDVPWEMDGVPYLTQDPVPDGEAFTYEFEAKPAGTHMFHCHVDTTHHTDMGMYGLIIVEPNEPDKYAFDSEDHLLFDDWDSKHLHQTSNDPQMTADSTTDDSGDPLNQIDRTESQVRETYNNPQYPIIKDHYSNPARGERDWYPVTYAPWQPVYDTYTINGKSFPYTDPIDIKEGEKKKLRLANIGNSPVSFHVHGHHFQVTHTDGHPVAHPWVKDTILIGPGERYDILIEGNNPGIWMMHSHIGQQAQNDHISPGGIMTHLVYEGFEGGGGVEHDHGKKRITAGDFLGLYR